MVKVILPELGEGIEKATLTFWYFRAGDKVTKETDLIELATDKAAFNLPCPANGTLTEIFFNEGDSVNIGEVIALIEEEA